MTTKKWCTLGVIMLVYSLLSYLSYNNWLSKDIAQKEYKAGFAAGNTAATTFQWWAPEAAGCPKNKEFDKGYQAGFMHGLHIIDYDSIYIDVNLKLMGKVNFDD